jgi:hypothetical protein
MLSAVEVKLGNFDVMNIHYDMEIYMNKLLNVLLAGLLTGSVAVAYAQQPGGQQPGGQQPGGQQPGGQQQQKPGGQQQPMQQPMQQPR